MSRSSAETANRLRAALESGRLSQAAEDKGENLLSRLTSPVRIALLGARNSGKSSLLNVLAGAKVVPGGYSLPTLQLTLGPDNLTTCTYAGGKKQTFKNITPEQMAMNGPIFIEMQRNLPALKRVALLEVVMDGKPAEQQKALKWATDRCDVALWCTQDFAAPERALWATVPDKVKDHAFMVLTRADALGGQSAIIERLADLKALSAGSFYAVRPVATLQALDAITGGKSVDTDGFKRSGAQALIASVMREVEIGRQSVRDAAELLLTKVELGKKPAKAEATPAAPAPAVASAPSPVAAPEPAPTPEPALEPEVEVATQPEPAPTPAPETEVAKAPGKPALSSEARESIEGVITYLADRGTEWTKDVQADPKSAHGKIMKDMVDDVAWLDDFLAEPFHDDEEAILPTRQLATDMGDLVQLMEMERTDTATVDAVCLMLQAKRSMQELLAA